MNKSIFIKNANHNNLKNISIEIPHNKLTLITGVSGSGKSTLAFDTLYAEGQRRFVESLSSYARQFLERMVKPDVESITGLLPAIAIQQKTSPRNPRSTVGTITEIYDYIRALYARIGKTICAECGKEIVIDNPVNIANKIINSKSVTKTKKTASKKASGNSCWDIDDKVYIMIELFPPELTKHRAIANANSSDISVFMAELERLEVAGFSRIVSSNSNDIIDFEDLGITHKTNISDYFILVDRWIVSDNKEDISRLVDSLEVAFSGGTGRIIVRNITKNFEEKFSNIYECADCKIKYEEPTPRTFAFNTPQGACEVCHGTGQVFDIDEGLVVPDDTLSLREHCIHPYRTPQTASVFQTMIEVCKKHDVPIDIPYQKLTDKHKDIIWNGSGKYFGLNEYFKFIESKNHKIQNRLIISKYRGTTVCRSCGGSRLKFAARQVYVNGKNIPEIVSYSFEELYAFLKGIKLTDSEYQAAGLILNELIARSKMLIDIGLEYLALSRSCHTLSGGEYQRINLSTALGSTLVGTLYVLDEPSIGMHSRDTDKLLHILYRLRNLGNTIVVVEHDLDIIRKADFIVDMGPGAGTSGGNIVASGSYEDILKNNNSLTAKYFNRKKRIEIPTERRKINSKKITVVRATENNLRIEKCKIPLNNFVVVTGVSGSGKSTLVHDVLYRGVLEHFGGLPKDNKMGKFKEMLGLNHIKEIDIVSQTPIGKSSRSTPATYMKVFDYIRELYAQTQAAVQFGIKPGYFSFNVTGGRCEECEGEGYINVDMQFLPDIKVRCESCEGTRYKKEIANILYKGKSIIDVLEMTVDEALEHFSGITRIESKLNILKSVGLDYLKLGQPSGTLSGGESQRIKLASHIDSRDRSECLYIFDEPTTGLHLDDISKLICAINQLVDGDNSVVIIEHNLHIMAVADWIIDLGPEAGKNGGLIVGEGTPEDIAKLDTHTGRALKEFLSNSEIR